MSADCNWCNSRYHLNQRNDIEGKDCGQVWIDEQYMALQFACDRCLVEMGAAEAPGELGSAAIREITRQPERVRTRVRRHYKRRD